MNTKGLSLNTIPPLSIPLRFFLTAPFFGILAALLILYNGPEIWSSRWSPDILAITHLFTIGFMLMVMFGAMYQFIPVMVGQLISGSLLWVPIIHPLLILGTLALCSAFLLSKSVLFWIAFFSLGIAVLLFSLSLLHLLITVSVNRLIVFLLRTLFIVLMIAIGLGLLMLFAYAYPESGIAFRQYTDLHALWGMLGWSVLLIMAVGSQVIPMFYVTPEFSIQHLKFFSFFIVLTLFLISLVNGISSDLIAIESLMLLKDVLYLLLSFGLFILIVYSLYLFQRRKRKVPDMTIRFFVLSLISLLSAIISWWVFKKDVYVLSGFQIQNRVQFELTLATLLIYGLALSAIIGMLQKIIPFLIFLHLQHLSFKHPGSIALVPNTKMIISTRKSKIPHKA